MAHHILIEVYHHHVLYAVHLHVKLYDRQAGHIGAAYKTLKIRVGLNQNIQTEQS